MPRLVVTPAGGAILHRRHGVDPQRRAADQRRQPTAVTANNSPVVNARRGQDHPDADAVHADRLGHRRRRRHAHLPVGADRRRRRHRHGRWPTTTRSTVRCSGCSAISARSRAPDSLLSTTHPARTSPGRNPSRTFPDLAQILAGNTNAGPRHLPGAVGARHDPGHRPALDCFSEFLPTTPGSAPRDRVLHFRLTARDEFTPDGGGDDPAASRGRRGAHRRPGRRAVPGHLPGHGRLAGASGAETVTWDVGRHQHGRAGAEREDQPVDRRRADLPDGAGGHHGQRRVAGGDLPNVTTTTARIKVEAVGNYFFDINDADFTIEPAGPNTAPTVNAGPDGASRRRVAVHSSGAYTDDVPDGDRDGGLRRRGASSH